MGAVAKTMKHQRQAGFLMAKIRQVGERIFYRKLKESGIEINPGQGRIMFALWQNDGISIQELARKTQLGKSTLTSMLDRLEAMGYIRRQRSEQDRRKIFIFRTPKDRMMERQYVELSEDMTELWYRGFSPEEIETFEASLQRILDNCISFEASLRGQVTPIEGNEE
jgi:DNA-binding MarR family transcriptional regulator